MAHSGGAGVPAGGEEGDGSFAAALSRGQTAGAVFCKRCGAMLTLPDSGDARCDVCGAHVPLSELAGVEVVTTGRKRPAAQWLAEFMEEERRQAGGGEEEDVARRATVEEECPKCRNPTMNYWTMQLRSADEGQTVFYECPKCHHTFSTNT